MRKACATLALMTLGACVAGCGDSTPSSGNPTPPTNTAGTGMTPAPVAGTGGMAGAAIGGGAGASGIAGSGMAEGGVAGVAPIGPEPEFVPGRPKVTVPNGEWPETMVNVGQKSCAEFKDGGVDLWRKGIVSPTMGDEHHNQPSIINGYLLLAGNAEHYFWNITDPKLPTLVSTFTSPDNMGEAESHQISFGRKDDEIYAVTTSGKGVDIWDITDPALPKLLKALPITGIKYGDVAGGVWGISWQGDHIYVGANDTGLHILDASNPAETTLVKTLTVGDVGGEFPGPLWAIGNVLVITSPKGKGNVATMDISDPLNPILLDSFHPKESYIGAFYGKHVYLQAPLRVWDVLSDPTTIGMPEAPLGTLSTPGSEYMSFHDGFMFLGHLRPNPGASKIDVSNPTQMSLVSRIWGRCDLDQNDDQFTLAVGPLLVMADDEKKTLGNVGSVIAVHDTKPDKLPPSVVAMFPKDGATGQPLTTRIGLSLSDHVEIATVTNASFVVRPKDGKPVAGTFGMTTTTLNFDPVTPLEPATTYEVLLRKDGITDLVGNAIAEDIVTTFTTK